MNKLVKESEYFLAWLVFWLCSTFGGGIVGFVGGFIVGVILGASGMDVQSVKLIGAGIGFLAGIPISYLLFRVFVGAMIVKKIEARASTMETPPPSRQTSADA